MKIPKWVLPADTKKRASVLLCHTSDWHMGEVIKAEEIAGFNDFNPEICAARLKTFTTAAVHIGSRWTTDTDCRGVVLTMAGDLVSGDIHDELRETNALTSTQQVRTAIETGVAMIRALLEAYGRVHVVGVPGNHGRTTMKKRFKQYANLSYDTLIVSLIAERFADDAAVTFQISSGTDATLTILGHSTLVTHGDNMGTGGGMGFIGPIAPIVRGGAKVRAQQASVKRPTELILMGHYHTSANPPGVLANGSIPGYSEFGNGIRAAVEPPKQWLGLIRQRWGLAERVDVQLEEPRVFAAPASGAPKALTSV